MRLLLVHSVCVLKSTEIVPFVYEAICKKNLTFLVDVYLVALDFRKCLWKLK